MPTESPQNVSYEEISRVLGAPVASGTQTITLSGTSQALTLIPGKMYRLYTTSDCHVIFTVGGSTAATTSDCRIAAGLPEFFSTVRGGFTRIAAIQNSAAGTLYVSELG
jgi:hypothetical protein